MQYFNPDKVDTCDFEHRDISGDELAGITCEAHELRTEFDKVFAQQPGEGK